jgi:hypothetical protein
MLLLPLFSFSMPIKDEINSSEDKENIDFEAYKDEINSDKRFLPYTISILIIAIIICLIIFIKKRDIKK